MEPRFPEDVAYDVMYDTTVFVDATIESVKHTLIEAFVLVAIVVFVFLGNLRATLIPIIAVPVALIGTFAVMLALGFSANTISLLALVLAIGIVVDDAIVVVEAVEHILEHEPRPHPGRGDREGHGPGHRADHRHHPGAALGLRADGLHPRHHRPALQAIRRRRVGLHGDLGDQRADPVAGALLADPAPSRQAHGRHGLAAERHRQDAATATSGWSRRWPGAASSRVLLVGVFVLGAGGLNTIVPSGFLPDEDQGAFMAEVQLPDAASTNRTVAALQAGRGA